MRERLRDALRAGLRYLAEMQSEHGAWSDFQLCGAESDAWVTAYVTASLGEVPALSALAPSLERARMFLVTCVRDGGWGFNAHAPVDADSTSWALCALEPGCTAANIGVDGLLRHQRPDGGFSCFVKLADDESAWARSHEDISAVALRALVRNGARDQADRCAKYVRACRAEDGTWPAFWYLGSCYTTLHALTALHAYEHCDTNVSHALAALEPMRTAEPFNAAHVLEATARFDPDAARSDAIDELIAQQRRDGRWVAGATFMKPNPWNHDPGDPDIAVRDQRAIFTTATVLRALGTAYEAAIV